MKKFILALCGLPASGKSSLADAIQKALDFEVEIVRTDDWRDDAYYTDWEPEKEKPVREAALAKVEKFAGEGRSVIHDDTNYYTSMRHELFKIAIENGFGFAIIQITTPVITALRWNQERPDSKIPDSVIEDIFERFDNPGRRYLWDNSDLEVDMETQELGSIVPEIIEILEGLEPAYDPPPSVITSTDFNKTDTETRQIVSRFLKENPALRGNREVSIVRRTILREANQGTISLESVGDRLLERLSELL
ncbi:MAG: AAA family ATPase [Candidatus Thorarchaeota archaeon]